MPDAHRVVRSLDASETPFGGLLVTRGEGVAVQVDAGELAGWVGWRFAGAEHVAAPLDIVRRRDGHDVLLPWCTERVTSLLARRHVIDEHLSLGECSTLVASVLRGIDELGEPGAREGGTWWVTGEGRPVFVVGEGESACVAAGRVVELVAEGCRDRGMGRVLAQVQMGLHLSEEQPRVPRRQIEDWESALLQIATPRPLRCDVLTPERARDVARGANARPRERQALGRRGLAGTNTPTPRRVSRAESSGLVRPAIAAVQQRAGGVIRRVVFTLSGRGRSVRSPAPMQRADAVRSGTEGRLPPRPRRRSLLIAAAAAVAVLAGGMLWPGGESGEASEGGGAPAPSPLSDFSTSPPAAAEDDLPATDDPTPLPSSPPIGVTDASESEDTAITAVASLLIDVAACSEGSAPSCAEGIAEGSTVDAGVLAEIAATEPVLTPVDEYGDIAVVRAESEGVESEGAAVSRILVLVRTNDEWLVRDVYDVANQPS